MDITPIQTHARRYVGVYIGIGLFIFSFGLGIFVGQAWYIRKQARTDTGQVDITKVISINRTLNKSDAVDFNQFWQVWDRVKEKYAKQPVKDTDLFYGALQGLVFGLNDPYSVYFPPKPAEEFAKSLSGEFSGIGAEIGVKQGQLVVISPLPETPAFRAGLRPGDRIIAIDKRSTVGMDVNTAVEHIRGPAGTTTTLTIGREGLVKPKDYTITREKIYVPAIIFAAKPGNIVHIRAMQFNENTLPQFNKFVDQIHRGGGVKGIILDLRNNPGGYLESAVQMASHWIGSGTIVIEKYSDGKENVHGSEGPHSLVGFKTVVLVNSGSASASEIVAGALQDYKAATIIGEKTFGKGSVQDFEVFPDGSALKLTVAEWHTPNGTNINETGITPDIEVKENFEEQAVGEDKMVEKAMEILR